MFKRPIFMLFEKIRLEQKRLNKEKVIFCATNDFVTYFCYVARKNNFEFEGVIPVQIPGNNLNDYSDFPVIQDIPKDQKKKYLVVLLVSNLPQQNKEA